MADVNHAKRAREAVIAAVAELPAAAATVVVNRAARVAVTKLTEGDQMLISDAVHGLTRQLRAAGFTETMALELLAKLGWRLEAWGPGAAQDATPR